MKPLLSYSLLRVLLLLVVGGFAFAIGMRGLLLLVVAFVGSGVLSFFVLRNQRLQLGQRVGGVFQGINARIDSAAAAEDGLDLRKGPTPPPVPDPLPRGADPDPDPEHRSAGSTPA